MRTQTALLSLVLLLVSVAPSVATAATPLAVSFEFMQTDYVAIRWTQSQDACFVSYEVQYQLLGAGNWTNAGSVTDIRSTEGVVDGLLPGNTYDFRIVDHDCLGSQASGTLRVTVHPLMGLDLVDRSPTSVNVTWTLSTNPSYCFQKYSLSYRLVGSTEWTVYHNYTPETAVRAQIRDLIPNRGYEAKIREIDCGPGFESPMLTFTTLPMPENATGPASPQAPSDSSGIPIAMLGAAAAIAAVGAVGATLMLRRRGAASGRPEAPPDPQPPHRAPPPPSPPPRPATPGSAPARPKWCARCAAPLNGPFCGNCRFKNW